MGTGVVLDVAADLCGCDLLQGWPEMSVAQVLLRQVAKVKFLAAPESATEGRVKLKGESASSSDLEHV